MKANNKKDTLCSWAHSGAGAITENQEGGIQSDLRTRGIIDRILCDTLRQKLTNPLEVLWASHVFPGQGLRVWAGCRSSAGRHPLPEEPVYPTTMRICCPRKPPSSVCDWPIICSPHDTALWMFLIHYFHSLHLLTKQISLGHPLCARHFREVMRIKLALPSKKADTQKWDTHIVNCDFGTC